MEKVSRVLEIRIITFTILKKNKLEDSCKGRSFKEKMAYRVDNFMSRGPSSIFLALVIVFLIGFALLVAGRFAIEYFGPENASAESTETIMTI